MELIVVLAILALLAGMTLPTMTKTVSGFRLQADARQMAAVLKMARQQAITTGQPSTVIFYPGSAKYKLMGSYYHFLDPGIAFIGSTTFTGRLGGMPICGFAPSGAPTSGGTVTLGNKWGRYYIVVNPVVGRIRISENPPGEY